MQRNKRAVKRECHHFLSVYLNDSSDDDCTASPMNDSIRSVERENIETAESVHSSQSEALIEKMDHNRRVHVPENFGMRENIAKWSIEENITNSALNKLLRIIKPAIPELPLNARTLRGTPRNINKFQIEGGQYIHYGIKDCLTDFMLTNIYENERILLDFNIDGLPLAKSSGAQVWPILMNIKGTKSVFTIGVFEGYSKPGNVSKYLEMMISDLNDLIENGFQFRNHSFIVEINAFICDAPARAMILEIKGHSGYNSCHKCTQKGERYENRTIFPFGEYTLRKNEDFRNRSHPEHHNNSNTGLEELPIDIVQQFPFDYMHVVCLGVVRNLLTYWVKHRKMPYSLHTKNIRVLNDRLTKIQSYTPHEFARRPRPTNELDRWKATEFRNFLLYIGPIVMKDILNNERYQHFNNFSSAIRILHSSDSSTYNYAHQLLCDFVTEIPLLYGKSFLTYNVHCLTHIAADCSKYGPIHGFSAFKFENYLSTIKRKLKKKITIWSANL